ncbi:hypothetical protein GGR52DRAFT_561172 [Hypoxylon sp. FL1284]|nr:hypothetical protein GGR52DRAFT_561172 [Hypoxylon sp. FL1284]
MSRKYMLKEEWQPRCHLCHFMIPLDGQSVDFEESGEFSTTIRYGTVGRSSRVTVLCHRNCLRVVPEHQDRFFLATTYAYDPPIEERKRRTAWLLDDLTTVLKLPRYVAFEIRQMIAEHLLCEYAASKAALCWLGPQQQPTKVSLDASTKIWARYTEFEGVRYVSDLSNKPGEEYELVFVPDLARPVKCIYMSEDHLGIRQVYFSSSMETPRTSRSFNVWWMTLRRPSPVAKVRVKSDGMKIRDVGWTDQASPVRSYAWELPRSPNTYIRLHTLADKPSTFSENVMAPLRVSGIVRVRMASLRCNDSDITGYSVCWNHQPTYLHAHSRGEDLSFYDTPLHQDGIWLYMPLHETEFLEDIWIRRNELPRDNTLVFRTSKGRITIAGTHTTSMPPQYSWTHLCTLQNVPSQLFFESSNKHPYGISDLGLETRPPTPKKAPVASVPSFPFPINSSVDRFFYSSASLVDVVGVRPCCLKRGEMSAIIGLILRDSDGFETAVGQVRLDTLQDSVQIDRSEKMTLEFSKNGRVPYATGIHFAPMDHVVDANSEQSVLLDVPWKGKIEWWFSERQCRVFHNGKTAQKKWV